MMSLKVDGLRRALVGCLDKHRHICDLIYVDGPLLSLYRDTKHDWMYLWIDTDMNSVNRWLLFEIDRKRLVEYLDKTTALLDLILKARRKYVLEGYRQTGQRNGGKSIESLFRSLFIVDCIDVLSEYLPDSDSYFDESLTPDISLTRDFLPTRFDVPIDGNWFVSDLNKFGRVYTQVYSYFYCTQPRFIKNISAKLRTSLHSSWRGGSNRVKLFDDLKNHIPALHDLKIEKMAYASPGEVTIEALESVGRDIGDVVLLYVKHVDKINESTRMLNRLLDGAKLKRKDLSKYTDINLPVELKLIGEMKNHVNLIVSALNIQKQHAELCDESPNVVVSTKVLLALITRISFLADLQRNGLIQYE